MVPVSSITGEGDEEADAETPLEDRNFACIGLVNTTNYFRTGEAQALWLTAWFDGVLTSSPSASSSSSSSSSLKDPKKGTEKNERKAFLPPPPARRNAVAAFIAWNKRRYLSLGVEGNSVSFDTLRYTDHLLEEIGLKSHLPASSSLTISTSTSYSSTSTSSSFSLASPSGLSGLVNGVKERLWWFWLPNWYKWWKLQYFRPNAASVYRGLREEYKRLYGGGAPGRARGGVGNGNGIANGKVEGKKIV
jgi:hypothetical protein